MVTIKYFKNVFVPVSLDKYKRNWSVAHLWWERKQVKKKTIWRIWFLLISLLQSITALFPPDPVQQNLESFGAESRCSSASLIPQEHLSTVSCEFPAYFKLVIIEWIKLYITVSLVNVRH